MKILISPSKTIDFETKVKNHIYTTPRFAKEALGEEIELS